MAEMGNRGLKSNPLLTPTGDAAKLSIGLMAGAFVGTVICAPANPISMVPIMPDGFVTYTDFDPAAD